MGVQDPERRGNIFERAFPIVMRYAGLVLALYEGLIDRPPQSLVVALAAVMMAGAQVLERIVQERGGSR